MKTEIKEKGRVYTPKYIVDNILDLSSYCGNGILKKHVIDNSCGDGAFLCKIVSRYCCEAVLAGLSVEELHSDLETFIHGIEIEEEERKRCIDNINVAAAQYGIRNIEWDIICEDALNVHKYDGKMDFVLGNPPYVRVHNLGKSFDKIKEFMFTQRGMTDLFIVFYEIGLKMLSTNGTLGYITPSSFYNSVAGKIIRRKFANENLLDKIVDLKHYQPFGATTYTTIVILKKNRRKRNVDYYEYDGEKKKERYVDTLISDDYFVGENYYFAPKNTLRTLHKIFYNLGQCDIEVKNGYATLCDDVFVHDFKFNSDFIIPVVKSSRGIKQKIFFPYDKNGQLFSEDTIKRDDAMYSYLNANKDRLIKRSNERDNNIYWYAFGRSQAIMDTFKDKLAMSTLMRDEKDLKFTEAPQGTGVYGGLYIVSNAVPIEEIKNVLNTKEFTEYVMLLGKYKSGGYYTFSSKDVKRFLNYKFSYYGGLLYVGQ